jgi:SAM-dependent methyltransferase
MTLPPSADNKQGFSDHFSQHAAIYAQFRPSYPPALFEYLASLCANRSLAWDCATGSGQSAVGLTPYFKRIIATDASRQQLAHATPHQNIDYRLASAEQSELASNSVDLISVFQAAHWFNLTQFYAECVRVAKPGCVIVLCCYQLMQVETAIDQLIDKLYHQVLADFWPVERCLVDSGYQTIDFPFKKLKPPAIQMQVDWTLDQFLGYIQSWSAWQKYLGSPNRPSEKWLSEEFLRAWGNTKISKTVTWPLQMRVGIIR